MSLEEFIVELRSREEISMRDRVLIALWDAMQEPIQESGIEVEASLLPSGGSVKLVVKGLDGSPKTFFTTSEAFFGLPGVVRS